MKRDGWCEEIVSRAIPIPVRAYALGVAKKAARSSISRVIRGVSRLSRSSVYFLDIGAAAVSIRPRPPHIIFVSDLAYMAIHGTIPRYVVGEREMRVLYRGLVYHSILENLVEHESYFVELPIWIPISVDGQVYELHGTPDIVLVEDGGAIVVELKSSDREETSIVGMIQGMIYRRMLEDNMIQAICSCLATPTRTICVRRRIGIDFIEHLASLSISPHPSQRWAV
ncbi:MAG: hypothetical protein QXE01_10085 [Sulfolobales archaeon]